MKRKLKLFIFSALAAVIIGVVGLLISRQFAISKADHVMQLALNHGWLRFDTRLTLWWSDKFEPQWRVRYNHPNELVDFPPSIGVSLGGTAIDESASRLLRGEWGQPVK